MARVIAGVVGGVVAWLLIATIGNLAMRMAWASYARLLLGAFSSVAAGWLVAWITNRNISAIFTVVGILIVMFIPVHYALWERFPLWYHVVFFVSLAVMPLLGGRLNRHELRSGQSAG